MLGVEGRVDSVCFSLEANMEAYMAPFPKDCTLRGVQFSFHVSSGKCNVGRLGCVKLRIRASGLFRDGGSHLGS